MVLPCKPSTASFLLRIISPYWTVNPVTQFPSFSLRPPVAPHRLSRQSTKRGCNPLALVSPCRYPRSCCLACRGLGEQGIHIIQQCVVLITAACYVAPGADAKFRQRL